MLKGNSGFGGSGNSRGLGRMAASPAPSLSPSPSLSSSSMDSLTMRPPIVSPMGGGGNSFNLNPKPPTLTPPPVAPSLNIKPPIITPMGNNPGPNLTTNPPITSPGLGMSSPPPQMGLQRLSMGPRQPNSL